MVSFSKKISCIFSPALQDQLRDQPHMSGFYQICHTSFYQAQSLSLRRHICKNFQMFCLRNTQVKITVKLLDTGIIVGMINPGICCISNRLPLLYHIPCTDHILIKNSSVYKASHILITLSFICRAYIRAEIRLYPILFHIR